MQQLRDWMHRPINPLPAIQVGKKLLVRRVAFDRWLEAHGLKPVNVARIVEEVVAGVKS